MILAILFAVLGYKKAEATGRNKALWAVLMVVIFVAVQAIVGLVTGVIVAIGFGAYDWSETFFDDYYWPISILGVALSAAVCGAVLYFLGNSKKEEDVHEPPPPTEFGLG